LPNSEAPISPADISNDEAIVSLPDINYINQDGNKHTLEFQVSSSSDNEIHKLGNELRRN
jgi:hypothetical protein